MAHCAKTVELFKSGESHYCFEITNVGRDSVDLPELALMQGLELEV